MKTQVVEEVLISCMCSFSIELFNEGTEMKSEEFFWKQENNWQQELDEKEQRVNKLKFDENVRKQIINMPIHTIYMENMKIMRRGLKFKNLYF